ncbi:hypothetical protein C7S16_5299 [Burkholderia thailandensis]|uniref:Uncharacterized protein n=1 Tax=Burkholderia thailandensis TaxID=57975 RepID=A0AAW9CYD6_BURTH|nr:hypothetical protein [Burkholderia thailandensis]MDW9253699.1 hypothetical protein [Burkholderia thailandensis]
MFLSMNIASIHEYSLDKEIGIIHTKLFDSDQKKPDGRR